MLSRNQHCSSLFSAGYKKVRAANETETDGSGVSRGDWSHSGCDTQQS
jgi:hypothetical protein